LTAKKPKRSSGPSKLRKAESLKTAVCFLKSTITSQNAAGGAQNVNITVEALRTFTFDRYVQVPVSIRHPQFSTLANEHCDIQGASCGDFDLRVPSSRVWSAAFDHNGNKFQQFTAPNMYSVLISAFSQPTGAPDWNSSTVERVFLDSASGQGYAAGGFHKLQTVV
jgi:hypothetical protein